MSQGRSIRLFLVDGTPHGLLTAEIMNWTGHVLTGPRGKLSELVQRPECGRTGVCFLVGSDAENGVRPNSLTPAPTSDDASPRFRMVLSKNGISAYGQEMDGEFFVLEGSQTREAWVGPTPHGYQRLFEQLVEEGVLVPDGSGPMRFSRDYAFSSPSAAAAMVVGRTSNGRKEWHIEDTGQSYGEWQEQLVADAAEVTPDEP